MAAPARVSSIAKKMQPLEAGDRLDQKTFHARYEAMPESIRAELVEGIVYMPSPLRSDHCLVHGEVMAWLKLYKAATPGTEVMVNATTILGESSEPQPDACLLILPGHSGQSREVDGYVTGAPELVVEVASSTVAYDLHAKRRDYELAGVREYLVLIVREQRAVWFVRQDFGFALLEPRADGIFCSRLFGGLWLDVDALFRCDTNRLYEVLQQGLASPEHVQIVERLKQNRS